MAPKKSEKEGKKKVAQLPTGEWTHSKCSLNDHNRLVSEGLLQDKNLVNWRPSFREPFPMENIDKIITFYHFAERGLALPSCSFFRGLLYYYGLELHHLRFIFHAKSSETGEYSTAFCWKQTLLCRY
jgi:hypothetical protein